MPIVRGKHSFEGHFTQLPNAWVRDKRLSYKARGLLAELMSHAPGFEVSREKLARNGQDGDRAIRSAIAELEAVGYLERSQSRSEQNRFGAAVWITRDPDSPSVPFAPTGNAPAGNAALKKIEVEKTKEERDLVQDELEPLFNMFWVWYPRKVAKGAAKQAFVKAARITDPMVIIAGAQRLAEDPNLPPAQFVPHATTWLNREGWEDEPYPERVLTPEEKAAKDLADLQARRAREAEQRELSRLEREAEAERIRIERETNPVEFCEHGRVVFICKTCSPILSNNSNTTN